MANDLVQTTECEAPVAVAFGYVANYRNVPDWLFGVSTFTPVGPRDHGLGSVFDAAMHIGVNVTSRVEIDEFVEDRLMTLSSIKGFSVRMRWSFEERGPDRTLITSEIGYGLPFGPAGKAMGKVVGPFIKQAASRSTAQLKAAIESSVRPAS